MIHLKTNPKGIDIPIQSAQQSVYDKLISAYSCDVTAYGRVYTDVNNESIKPYAYINGGEYKEVLHDDKINGIHFFFVEDDTSEIVSRSCLSNNDVDIIFIVDDLTKVNGDIIHYQDEEIKENVKSSLRGFFEVKSVTKGKEALNGFDVSQLKFIYPYFVFKITVTINNY
tara:strand:+ start:352 stop:861 length:510 start_codon:yes stop_codon:yes gene_type:complete